ncbi:hypothetical protein B0H15DRAFT_387306 [Mycena belliarum]|uniref:Uncharacterized protein n=1 Tax=Mycena belliarum TaxID=1033014 RepID=A0AAD6U137_9AGAR|nr:hypothetical protein B0H15DRAFT_387306 [Mycena belliae]
MEDDRHESEREFSHTVVAEQKTTFPPPDGKEFPFPPFPPANSSTLNEAVAGYQNRSIEPKRRSKSRSRSASSLLVLAAERLGQETNRANALDSRCAEVLAHLRTIVEDRDQLRRSLAKVTEELSLYKLQLDVAQNEIFRAQKIVEGVDKARVEAEEQAAKDRSLARQLVSERAVWVAREEGRNEGFEEGLREGRRQALESSRRRVDGYTDTVYEDGDEDPETYEASQRPRSASPRSLSPSLRPRSPSSRARSPPLARRDWSSPSRSVHSTLPDAASYTSTQPGPRTPPAPSSELPSTQSHQETTSHPPPAQYRNQSPSPQSSRPLPRAPPRSPEPIDILPDRNTSRARTASMSISRPPAPLPPDGFIPTVGADSVISLPPPHELSRPVSFVDDDTLRTPSIAPTPGGGRGRTISNASRGSTRFSEYDILSPPRRSQTPATRSDQVAQAWRATNANGFSTERRQAATATQDANSENFSTRSSLPRSQVSRRSGPRRPREIVMPMPLSTSMNATGTHDARPSASSQPLPQLHTGPSHPTRESTPNAPPAASYSTAPQECHEDTGLTRPRSALAWLKTRFNRSVSASSVPNIQIEPPSNPASNPSTDQTLNTVLLAPEDAGERTLPQHFLPELAHAFAGVQQADATGSAAGNVIVLPDNDLPRGFMPLSPISPIMPSLHTITPFPAPGSGSAEPSASKATAAARASASSPQPPAYSPRDIYAPPRPATAAGMRVRTPAPTSEASGSSSGSGSSSSSGSGRARGASIGSAMLQTSPAPLNRPISIFSET